MPKQTKYSLSRVIKRMLKHLFKHDSSIFLYFIIYTIAAALFPVINVIIPKFIITLLTRDTYHLNKLMMMLAAYFLINASLGFIETYTHNASYPRLTNLRIDYLFMQFKMFFTMDYKYAEDPSFGDDNELAFQACSSNNNGVEQIYHIMFEIFAKILSAIMYIIIVSFLSMYVLIAITISVLVGLITSNIVQRYQFRQKKPLAHASRKRNYYYQSTHNFQYGKDIRLYHLQPSIEKRYNNEIKNYLSVIKKIKNREFGLAFVDLFFVLLSDLVIYGFLIYQFFQGMTIADFTMYLGASLALSTTLKVIASDIGTIISEGRYVNALFEFLDTDFTNNPGLLTTIETPTLEVQFKNVSFKYPKTDKYIIKNLNLKIEAGEKLAIVGINGAGKTTIVKLLTRLFEVEEGELLINNLPAIEFDKSSYYDLFSVVFQNVNIFALSVADNITMGHDENHLSVLDAVLLAGLKDKTDSLPKGLQQMMLKVIDEQGVEFSGGENQKLAIARALYKNAKMVILDEPTAALDALAEAEIYEKFNRLVGNKTTIYISHRLASTKFCDKIALFNEDGLVEYGTHDELMGLKQHYYQMFVTQGQYYQTKEVA